MSQEIPSEQEHIYDRLVAATTLEDLATIVTAVETHVLNSGECMTTTEYYRAFQRELPLEIPSTVTSITQRAMHDTDPDIREQGRFLLSILHIKSILAAIDKYPPHDTDDALQLVMAAFLDEQRTPQFGQTDTIVSYIYMMARSQTNYTHFTEELSSLSEWVREGIFPQMRHETAAFLHTYANPGDHAITEFVVRYMAEHPDHHMQQSDFVDYIRFLRDMQRPTAEEEIQTLIETTDTQDMIRDLLTLTGYAQVQLSAKERTVLHLLFGLRESALQPSEAYTPKDILDAIDTIGAKPVGIYAISSRAISKLRGTILRYNVLTSRRDQES